ncbi:IS1634 family transposase [Clostridiaceae bacterium HSG29]|nr:IS1634 family transposase [Clostridiaceae bacterium HSG29]
MLTFSRILNPMSKKATVDHQDEYFEEFNVELNSVYKSLSNFSEIKVDLQNHLNEKITTIYGRDASLVFYDVTNYYFETEIEDDLKKKGPSKEKRSTPIVQMGLLIDSKGLPIAYDLFPGNTHDSSTLIPFIKNMRKQYNFRKVILTADKGLNSGKNLAYLKSKKDGYIVSQKIRGMSKAFINEVLSEEGYACNPKGTFKIKSFFRDRETKDEDGKKVVLKEKVVCFWSKDFDDREKHKREKLEERITAYLESPAKLKSSNSYGIKKYLKLQNIDTETGEIEESFRVFKTDLEGKPVYVRNIDHVEGHFLVCFIALLISRILEMKLENKYSIKRIQESLKNATCRKIGNGLYSLNKQNEVFRNIEKTFDISLNYSKVRIEQLRNWKKELSYNIKK